MFGGEAAEKPFPVNLIVQRICPVGFDIWKRVIEAEVIAVAAGKGLVQGPLSKRLNVLLILLAERGFDAVLQIGP